MAFGLVGTSICYAFSYSLNTKSSYLDCLSSATRSSHVKQRESTGMGDLNFGEAARIVVHEPVKQLAPRHPLMPIIITQVQGYWTVSILATARAGSSCDTAPPAGQSQPRFVSPSP